MQIRVVSWNIWGGRYLPKIVEYLKSTDADVIGLQEVLQEPDGRNNTAQSIADTLGYNYVYATAMPWEERGKLLELGNAILTRYGIIGAKTHVLSDTERRIAIQADISVRRTTLHALSTHLLHTHQKSSLVQTQQAENLIKILPKGKTLLMGDFNATPQSTVVKKVSNVLQNLDATHAPTWSMYSDGCPVCNLGKVEITLDYIFVSSNLLRKSYRVGESDGSDHLPISAIAEL